MEKLQVDGLVKRKDSGNKRAMEGRKAKVEMNRKEKPIVLNFRGGCGPGLSLSGTGQQGTLWIRTAWDRESWRTLVEVCLLQWKHKA